MELIKRLPRKLSKNGKNLESWGLFLCPICNQEKEMRLSNGYKAKSCGCQQHPIPTKELRQKISETRIKNGKSKGINNPMYGIHRFGEDNPMYGKKQTKDSKKKNSESNKGKQSGENNPMYGIHRFGEQSPNRNGGTSFEPYSPEFNKQKKKQVLERDNYTCQDPNCKHISDKLDIHHIDYDKKNNSPENLITLCASCHTKTNGKNNRLYYIEFYQNIMKQIYAN